VELSSACTGDVGGAAASPWRALAASAPARPHHRLSRLFACRARDLQASAARRRTRRGFAAAGPATHRCLVPQPATPSRGPAPQPGRHRQQ
jgi:hypothetical protein